MTMTKKPNRSLLCGISTLALWSNSISYAITGDTQPQPPLRSSQQTYRPGTARVIIPEGVVGTALSPDRRYVLVVCRPNTAGTLSLWLYDGQKENARKLWEQPTSAERSASIPLLWLDNCRTALVGLVSSTEAGHYDASVLIVDAASETVRPVPVLSDRPFPPLLITSTFVSGGSAMHFIEELPPTSRSGPPEAWLSEYRRAKSAWTFFGDGEGKENIVYGLDLHSGWNRQINVVTGILNTSSPSLAEDRFERFMTYRFDLPYRHQQPIAKESLLPTADGERIGILQQGENLFLLYCSAGKLYCLPAENISSKQTAL